jgi:hypothetical protein
VIRPAQPSEPGHGAQDRRVASETTTNRSQGRRGNRTHHARPRTVVEGDPLLGHRFQLLAVEGGLHRGLEATNRRGFRFLGVKRQDCSAHPWLTQRLPFAERDSEGCVDAPSGGAEAILVRGGGSEHEHQVRGVRRRRY